MNKETDVVYVVNRMQISASEYNQNGYTRTFCLETKIGLRGI